MPTSIAASALSLKENPDVLPRKNIRRHRATTANMAIFAGFI
jgi:hypothetical protein